MDKFVLIDGNSLLNRAFYAINSFSTKDGLPTNGIFGFVKLLFKIIDDEKPAYLAVAFDVHAPTFRHKMYPDYKGTRKPMPEELVRQVPELKRLLRAMEICTVEKEGYEADDLIGTLSRRFSKVHFLIYTGDRDAYQLVQNNVEVCFTKRGVSVTDRLTNENFFEKVGLVPSQIIEEKALMGDSSDNIPGVRGIGPKTALELLAAYGSAEEIFRNAERLSPSVRNKLAGQEEICRLSRTLATIDTNAPVDISLDECRLRLPFGDGARQEFVRLEFRSLIDDVRFSRQTPAPQAACAERVETVRDLAAAEQALGSGPVALCFENDGLHLSCGEGELLLPVKDSLLGDGFFREELSPLLLSLFGGDRTVLLTDVKAVAHRLAEMGIAIRCPVEDVSLLRYLIDSNQRTTGAKEYAQEYSLPETMPATAIHRAYAEGVRRMKGTAEEGLYRDIELPLAEVLFDMEQTGVRVDEEKFPEFSEKFHDEMRRLSERIYELAGCRFNLNSSAQLSDVLFVKLGYGTKGLKKTMRGGYSTNAETLEKLAEEHEIARLLLRHREIGKLQSTYIDGIRPLVREGVVHTTYNQMMTTTGRLSSANPNLQNIPIRKEEGRELRKLFIPREGNVFLDADYSQIELRLLAHFSECKPLIEAYREGRDIHAITASRVFGVPLDRVTPLMRRRAKAVNFGIIYGISAFGLARDVGCSTGEAQNFIDRYFATYTDVKEYMEENVRHAKADGYVTTILGRKRYIPELKSANYNTRSFGERAAMNMPLQGSSADIIKLAMLGVARRLRAEGLRTKLVLQVHDELVLDAPAEESEQAARILKEEMEGAVSLKVPLTAEVASGASWYDAK